MLELTLRLGQSLIIGDPAQADAAIEAPWHDANLIEVTVVEVRAEDEGIVPQVRLGVNAPREVGVHRTEIWLQRQGVNAAGRRHVT